MDPRASFPAFVEAVRARLAMGASAYQERPASARPLPELAIEMAQELEDLAGWAACLWPRVVALPGALGGVEATPEPAAALARQAFAPRRPETALPIPEPEVAPAAQEPPPAPLSVQLGPGDLLALGALSARLRMRPADVLRLAIQRLFDEVMGRRSGPLLHEAP